MVQDNSSEITDAAYPSQLTFQEKQSKLAKFGTVSQKDEGKTLEDKHDRVVEIQWDTYRKLLKYYGHWSKVVTCIVMGLFAT